MSAFLSASRPRQIVRLVSFGAALLVAACSQARSVCLASPGSTAPDSGGNVPPPVRADSGTVCSPPSADPVTGWASMPGMGLSGTSGGEGGESVRVSSVTELNQALSGTTSAVVLLGGTVAGDVTIGSNKTLVGLCGATIHGHVQMSGSVNVIVRNLRVVGYNCTDSPTDCSAGADAITVERAHHLWFDHDDISDGSDGNLDITHGADFITISWTKFHYSCRRTDPAGAAGGHQFSNLIGHSDANAPEDAGHLSVTFTHDWWADNVFERMPRVRFGKVHVFNSLYTSVGDGYCVGVGASANIRDENNVFVGVKNPINSTSYSDDASVIQSSGNIDRDVTGSDGDRGGGAFTPPYGYSLDPAERVQAAVMAGAGPR